MSRTFEEGEGEVKGAFDRVPRFSFLRMKTCVPLYLLSPQHKWTHVQPSCTHDHPRTAWRHGVQFIHGAHTVLEIQIITAYHEIQTRIIEDLESFMKMCERSKMIKHKYLHSPKYTKHLPWQCTTHVLYGRSNLVHYEHQPTKMHSYCTIAQFIP